MKSTNYDPCVYTNLDGSLLFAIYVDDGLVARQFESKVIELLTKLKEKFETTESEAKYFLGIEIEHDTKAKKIRIHQTYTRSILWRFKMDESNVLSTPLDANVVLRRNEDVNGNAMETINIMVNYRIADVYGCWYTFRYSICC